ncbi:iron permease [Dacryopinax primogenitus]|uniref:Iron permease n=1 Tax=Dacryopinax primogenitus (strain DJM 731) TaxID=1858805 RepID=M5GBD6_DACPD|nr:iron permease [Dacryopinax primogenitus]EJU01313.1 iron permease [Dacryopinax primogenitus]
MSSPVPSYGATHNTTVDEESKTNGETATPATIIAAVEEDEPAALESSNILQGKFKPDLGFWIIFVSLAVCNWLAALDLSCIATALPTIVSDLPGSTSFVWIGSAYALASTAIVPLPGNLANVFGRQTTLEGFIALFSIGSVVTGAAKNMNTAIAGRTVQGIGGGGMLALANIVVADLVPLRERGLYEAIMACVWAVTSVLGPPIGVALAQTGQWRWLFWMNLPLCAGAAGMVAWFLRLKRPPGSWKRKLRQVDWIGNTIIIGAAASAILALTQGGIDHPWSSYQIIVPLVIGLVGVVFFLIYEAFLMRGEPMVPLSLISNRTSLSGFAGAFVHGLVSILHVYYLPVFFQSCMLSSPLGSSIQLFPTAFTTAPFAIGAGLSITVTKHYVTQNVAAWVVCIIGFGLQSTLTKDSSTAAWVGYQVLTSTGLGVLWISTQFPVLAPQPASQNANALAFLSFVHDGANTFGVTIGAAVLQNELLRLLPPVFGTLFPKGVDIAYAAIPQIPSLAQPLQDEVRDAFSASLAMLWKITAGLCGLGLVTSLWMRQLNMTAAVDEDWGRQEKRDETVPLAPAGDRRDEAV